jgi:AcrR family transcriptional regulator
VVSNPKRRETLADAGLRVLARDGARGLTHRAVDQEAQAPVGTTSNYFRSRDALLGGLAERIMQRFAPDPTVHADLAAREPSTDLFVDYVRDIVRRLTAQPDLTRALLELRLEAARRPGLDATLGATLRRGYRDDVAFHVASGLAGGPTEIALLHYAIDGLMLDLLTVSIGADVDADTAVEAFVRRLISTAHEPGSGAKRSVAAREATVTPPTHPRK